MHHLIYSQVEQSAYPITFLVPQLKKDEMRKVYLDPYGVDLDSVLFLDLFQEPGKKKTPMAMMRQYITDVLAPVLKDTSSQFVMCADSEYFKALTKQAKAEPFLGYACDSEFGSFKVFYIPNYRQMFYDPIKVKAKIDQVMGALRTCAEGTYEDPGKSIIHFAEYPEGTQAIAVWLDKLLAMNVPLTIDIEGFDLKHDKCGIGSISFAWNKHEGIAFLVDYRPIDGATEAPFGYNVPNYEVRDLLKKFFCQMAEKQIYHNIAFDVYALIYQLFMKDTGDTEGLLEGLSVMLKNWDCTKLVTYLATNSCSGNKLGLKDQSQEFAGNYAQEEIKDITRIKPAVLLEYNLVDSLATWFVHSKHFTNMQKDQQEEIYTTLFKPATADIIQMQLTGLPVNMVRVKEVRKILEADFNAAIAKIQGNPLVQEFTHTLNEDWVRKRNSELKVKRVSMADAKEVFNPNSDPQVQKLLFEVLALPILSKTKSKAPSTDGDTLKALRNHTTNQLIIDLLNAMLDFVAVDKILTSFIPALERSVEGPEGWHYMFGNFNLGGTVSGRLSSSKPNLQNLPASSKYAKLIKSCIQAPPGWLFMGLDFASLEDRISALTTKDPNKLKVYTDGYDGHCLRTFSYWPEKCIGIVDTVESINSIANKGGPYEALRGKSKAPTFALTYQGTYITLMKNCGFSETEAKAVENSYKQLYKVSIDWVQGKLNQASRDGYITAAFGLRVRTPLLGQVIRGIRATPFEAEAEGRTAGNALGQSWCLLNSRAASEVMEQVRAHPEYRLNIRPCAHIHDAQYYLVKDDMPTVQFLHRIIVKAVNWQDHPDIAHPDVGLGGELSLFYPTWAEEMEIPNGANDDEILDRVEKHMAKLAEKKAA
jgi:DNA polymerase-1